MVFTFNFTWSNYTWRNFTLSTPKINALLLHLAKLFLHAKCCKYPVERETQNIFPILKGSSLTIFLGRDSRFFIELKQRENIKIETDCFNAL